jgi:hypothetical protein
MVEKAGNSLLGIIDDILDFSKLESGRIILNEMPFDLMDVTDEIINLFSVQTAKKNLHYCVIVNHRVPRILEGDAGRLRQLLINLISNSIKFTAKGSVIIELDFLKSENQLQIQVKDTGIGISADFFSEMYNPFSQEDSSDTRKYGGTGLGLAICKEIVTLMKGQIFCESTENLGTTFKISLPVKPMEIGKLDFKKVEKKIILTGDNQKNLKMMHQFLLRLNCDFTIVDLSDIYDMKIENEIIFCVLSMEETKRMSKDNFARCSHSDEIIFFTPFELLQRKNRLLTPENIILQPFPIGFRKLETICL